jgi:hypothetical protein
MRRPRGRPEFDVRWRGREGATVIARGRADGVRFGRRFALAVASALLTFAFARASEAATKAHKAPPAPAACLSARNGAEARTEAGRLLEARELLLSCAKPSCGASAMQQCSARLLRLESDIPSVVPVVTNPEGEPVIDVEVRSEGTLLASRLDGRGLLVDPGVHEFSFSAGDRVFATRKIMIVEGQRNRPIAVSLPQPSPPPTPAASAPAEAPEPERTTEPEAPPPVAPPRRERHGPSPVVYGLGGLGLAALGAGALLTFWGNRDNAALASCSPTCIPADTDHIRALYLASDITFGVGAAALGAAAVLFFTTRSRSDAHPTQAAYVFSLEPTRGGSLASIAGTF